jgi:hypothetical protein
MKLPKLTDEQLDAIRTLLAHCIIRAYRDAGYETVSFGDGSVGILKATNKMLRVTTLAQDHFAVAIGAEKYIDPATQPTTIECPDCRCESNIDHSCSQSIARARKR